MSMDVDRVYGGSLFTKEKFLFYQRLPSTQGRARELIRNGTADAGYVIIADEQYNGRGRFGREWLAEGEKSLTFSFVVKKNPLLTIQTAVSVIETLKEEYNLKSEIKWPNDIVIDGRKICGILVEMEKNLAIVGVGINVNETIPPYDNATSIRLEIKRPVSRELFLSSFFPILEENLKRGNIIIETARKHLSFLGRYVEIETKDGILKGEFIDIGGNGEMIMRVENGAMVSLLPGEVKKVIKQKDYREVAFV